MRGEAWGRDTTRTTAPLALPLCRGTTAVARDTETVGDTAEFAPPLHLTSGRPARRPCADAPVRQAGCVNVHIYVHIPWCLSRCPYCDFNTFAARTWPEQSYADGLLRELETHLAQPRFAGARVTTLYFGGGTPSLFSPTTIARLIDGVAARAGLKTDAEITLEANPGTVDAERLAGFHSAGVNRLSIGVQSFDDARLRWLGRAHDADASRATLVAARRAGFDNFSLDLIHAVPGQTRPDLLADLDEAVAFEPTHISAYSLTFEPGTPLTRELKAGRVQRASEEVEAELFETVRDHLATRGYPAYEISNHARPGFASRHNQAYGQGAAYIGLGAGAWSFAPAWGTPRERVIAPNSTGDGGICSALEREQQHVPFTAPDATGHGWGQRWRDLLDPGVWLEAVSTHGHAIDASEVEELTRAQAMGETCWLGLRQTRGLERSIFVDRFGEEPAAVYPVLDELLDGGLLEATATGWALTRRGLLVADAVFARFLI